MREFPGTIHFVDPTQNVTARSWQTACGRLANTVAAHIGVRSEATCSFCNSMFRSLADYHRNSGIGPVADEIEEGMIS